MNAPVLLHGKSERAHVRRRGAPCGRRDAVPAAKRPRIVIVGAGFAGLNAALGLARAPVDVTLIDTRNHHLFQPLLYQVATAGLSPAQIAIPVRRVFAGRKNVKVLMETVQGVDPQARSVTTCTRRLNFDILVLATGARHAYFGNEHWERFAPGLKSIADATHIRSKILTAFEKAEVCEDPAERARYLTFVVVGGGATGIEVAGSIAELARKALAHDFRNIDPSSARILLVEAGRQILPTFPPTLSQRAGEQASRLGVEVLTGRSVTDCNERGVTLSDGMSVSSACVVWAAGVMASPAAAWLNADSDRAGRIVVGGDLTVPGHPDIFAIGDTALVSGQGGVPVPGVAPAAKQMGQYVARTIIARLNGGDTPPFRYRNMGSLSTIGRKAAVADLGTFKLTGFPAWLVWSFVHLLFLVGFRNRLIVMLDWTWSYVTFERGARLIAGQRPDWQD